MLRKIGATLAGIVLAVAVFVVVQLVGNALDPPPPHAESFGDAMRNGPAWIAAALAGSWLAARLARSVWPAVVLGALVACGVVANMLTIPHPLWMWITSIVLVALVTLGGAALGARR
jgi:hypothetical protein